MEKAFYDDGPTLVQLVAARVEKDLLDDLKIIGDGKPNCGLRRALKYLKSSLRQLAKERQEKHQKLNRYVFAHNINLYDKTQQNLFPELARKRRKC